MSELYSLKNKTAIVTGALGLLGREHCKALAEFGASIIAVDNDAEKCSEFASELNSTSIGLECNIADPKSVELLFNTVYNIFPDIDILVNNAAINDMVEKEVKNPEQLKFENYTYEMFKSVLDVNVLGVFNMCQKFGQELIKARKGSIINIASTYGIVAPNQSLYLNENNEQTFYKTPAYPVSKAAVISLTKYLASYWGEYNIRVNALSPGGVQNGQKEFFINKYSERTPLKRMAKADDYKGALVFLASDSSSYMTGANLVVDGGWTIW